MARKLTSIFLLSTFFVFLTGLTPVARHFMIGVDRSLMNSKLDSLHGLGVEIAGVNMQKNKVYLLVHQSKMKAVQALGLLDPAAEVRDIFERRPDSEYKSPDEVAAILKQWEQTYPNLARVQSIGKSVEGRDIWAIKISEDVNGSATKPAIMFNGMHHAREVMSVEVPLDIAEYLLTNYGKDATVTAWLKAMEVHIVPMLNVDGNNKVWTEDNMWRKNNRGGYGVDNERNYPYAWGSCYGSGNSTYSETYRGPSPASEPETTALMSLVTAVRPVFDIGFHSFSELVLYPYGCGDHTDAKFQIEKYGEKMASLLVSDDGRSRFTPGLAPELLYSVDGASMDWMHHEYGVLPFIIEVNSDSQGFQPGYAEWRESTVKRIRPGWQYLMERLNAAIKDGVLDRAKLTP